MDLHVIRHQVIKSKTASEEEHDPANDLMVIVHRNPEDPDDPTEFGHGMLMSSFASRAESWGLPDYATTIQREMDDLQRFYAREPGDDYGNVHPLGHVTEHYFEAPRVHMRRFNPNYVIDGLESKLTVLPQTTDGAMRMVFDIIQMGLDDVKVCLRSSAQKNFPCKGMTGLSSGTVTVRSALERSISRQIGRLRVVPSKAVDDLKQFVTDQAPLFDRSADDFTDRALIDAKIPEIMRTNVAKAATERGLLREWKWT